MEDQWENEAERDFIRAFSQRELRWRNNAHPQHLHHWANRTLHQLFQLASEKYSIFRQLNSFEKKNYQLCLTKNIRSVLLLPNLKNLFKKRLELEFQREIVNIELKIGNIHHSSRIRFNSQSILEKFIPQLQGKFKIDECLVTQEQNTPMQTMLANLLQEGYTFLSINLKLLNKTSIIRLQVDRTKVFTHATIILTQFTQKT